jgi:hypothetical protein
MTLLIPGGTIKTEAQSSFGQEPTPTITPVNAESTEIASNL